DFHAFMEKVRELVKDGAWGTLAALRLGGPQLFKERMDELIKLDARGGEECRAFLDLAEEHLPKLSGDLKVKCLFYTALCHDLLNSDRAIPLYEALVKEHPASAWAAEAAFARAERLYRNKEFAKAKAAYLDMAECYSKSPRAALAREWAGWVDELEP